MKVFISHASKDEGLAAQLADQLRREGFAVWNAAQEIEPGDNWAKEVGRALDESDVMMVLITQGAFKSESLRKEIQFGLTSRNFERRLIPVLVNRATLGPADEVPWILLRLNPIHITVASRGIEGFEDVTKRVHEIAARQETNAPC